MDQQPSSLQQQQKQYEQQWRIESQRLRDQKQNKLMQRMQEKRKLQQQQQQQQQQSNAEKGNNSSNGQRVAVGRNGYLVEKGDNSSDGQKVAVGRSGCLVDRWDNSSEGQSVAVGRSGYLVDKGDNNSNVQRGTIGSSGYLVGEDGGIDIHGVERVGVAIAENSPKFSNIRRTNSYSSQSPSSRKTVQFKDGDEPYQNTETSRQEVLRRARAEEQLSNNAESVAQVSVEADKLQGRSMEEYLSELQRRHEGQELQNNGNVNQVEVQKFLYDNDSDDDSGWSDQEGDDSNVQLPGHDPMMQGNDQEGEMKDQFRSNVTTDEIYGNNNKNNTNLVRPADLFRYVEEGRMSLEAMQVLLDLVDGQQDQEKQVQQRRRVVNSNQHQLQQKIRQRERVDPTSQHQRQQNVPNQQVQRDSNLNEINQRSFGEQVNQKQYTRARVFQPYHQQLQEQQVQPIKLQETMQQLALDKQQVPQNAAYETSYQVNDLRSSDEDANLIEEQMQERELDVEEEGVEQIDSQQFNSNGVLLQDSDNVTQDQDDGQDLRQYQHRDQIYQSYQQVQSNQQNDMIWRTLDEQFLRKLSEIKPTQQENECMQNSIQIVKEILTAAYPLSKCHLYGSVGNDLWVHRHNDLDICIETIEQHSDHEYQELIVHEIGQLLEQYDMKDIEPVRRARIPICKFVIPATKTEVDISVNNLLPVYNTKLLNSYCRMDPQIRDLIYIVKQWAKSRKLNDTRMNTLSSYAYAVLVIHFMQKYRGVPNLQEDAHDNCEHYKGCNVYFRKNVGKLQRRREDNILLGELVCQFFKYFNWFLDRRAPQCVISIRCGGVILKSQKSWGFEDDKRHLFSIEDPFEEDHDLGDVVTDNTFHIICREFNRAYRILREDYLDINKLFDPRRIGNRNFTR